MDNPFDLFRSFKPNEVLTTFRFNSSEENVTLNHLYRNVPPKSLGCFKLDKDRKEVELLYEGTVMGNIPRSFRPEICSVKRLADGGISCFSAEAYFSDVEPLPPVSDAPLETARWYFLKTIEIEGNSTLREYLHEEPDSMNFQYNGRNSAVFLCFRLPAGVHLPPGFEAHFDNDPKGHRTIRRTDFNPFCTSFCKIRGGFNYAMIPDLVNMGWNFQGLKLLAAAEPDDYDDSYDKNTWTLAAIIHTYFGCLSSEKLVNDAVMLLTELSREGYSRKSCSSPIIAKVLLHVLDDLIMCCDHLEIDIVSRFKLDMTVMNVFESI